MAKAYLWDKKVEFEDMPNQSQARAMAEKSGEMGMPRLWINDEIVIGFKSKHP